MSHSQEITLTQKSIREDDDLRAQINAVQNDSAFSSQEKQTKIKAMVDEKFPKTEHSVTLSVREDDDLRAQINAVQNDSALSPHEKQTKIKAMVDEKYSKK